MSQEVADTLRKALDVLRERGLAKFALRKEDGRVCGLGALSEALYGDALGVVGVGGDSGFYRPGGLLTEVAREQWPERALFGWAGFNNHPDTTQDDVERAFEKAIARAEEMVE